MGSRLKNLAGKKFDKLLVIDRAPNKKNWTMWNCICDCGKECVAYSTHLLRGNVTSCGCNYKKGEMHRDWSGYGEISGKRWSSIKRINQKGQRLSRINIPFDITIEYAWNLFIKQNRKCALSGQLLQFSNESKHNTASLDRIDNTKGYVDGNVQWVHKDINRMKNIFDNDYFVFICKMIANKNVSGNCEL